MLEIKGLTKRYISIAAVDDASFRIAPGEVPWVTRTEWFRQEHHGEAADRPA